jgi:hypothetical protein
MFGLYSLFNSLKFFEVDDLTVVDGLFSIYLLFPLEVLPQSLLTSIDVFILIFVRVLL